MDILDGKMIQNHCMGDLDGTDDIQNNMDETLTERCFISCENGRQL